MKNVLKTLTLVKMNFFEELFHGDFAIFNKYENFLPAFFGLLIIYLSILHTKNTSVHLCICKKIAKSRYGL